MHRCKFTALNHQGLELANTRFLLLHLLPRRQGRWRAKSHRESISITLLPNLLLLQLLQVVLGAVLPCDGRTGNPLTHITFNIDWY
jgi:hypothetical protein